MILGTAAASSSEDVVNRIVNRRCWSSAILYIILCDINLICDDDAINDGGIHYMALVFILLKAVIPGVL